MLDSDRLLLTPKSIQERASGLIGETAGFLPGVNQHSSMTLLELCWLTQQLRMWPSCVMVIDIDDRGPYCLEGFSVFTIKSVLKLN